MTEQTTPAPRSTRVSQELAAARARHAGLLADQHARERAAATALTEYFDADGRIAAAQEEFARAAGRCELLIARLRTRRDEIIAARTATAEAKFRDRSAPHETAMREAGEERDRLVTAARAEQARAALALHDAGCSVSDVGVLLELPVKAVRELLDLARDSTVSADADEAATVDAPTDATAPPPLPNPADRGDDTGGVERVEDASAAALVGAAQPDVGAAPESARD